MLKYKEKSDHYKSQNDELQEQFLKECLESEEIRIRDTNLKYVVGILDSQIERIDCDEVKTEFLSLSSALKNESVYEVDEKSFDDLIDLLNDQYRACMLLPELEKQQQITEETVQLKMQYGLKLLNEQVEDQKEKKTQIADLKAFNEQQNESIQLLLTENEES